MEGVGCSGLYPEVRCNPVHVFRNISSVSHQPSHTTSSHTSWWGGCHQRCANRERIWDPMDHSVKPRVPGFTGLKSKCEFV